MSELCNVVAAGHVWLLSTLNVARVSEAQDLTFHLNVPSNYCFEQHRSIMREVVKREGVVLKDKVFND